MLWLPIWRPTFLRKLMGIGHCIRGPDSSASFLTGAKEIDIAATVEHLRDQRPSMVKTKVSDQTDLSVKEVFWGHVCGDF